MHNLCLFTCKTGDGYPTVILAKSQQGGEGTELDEESRNLCIIQTCSGST